jgi:hypothetical protein
MEKETGTPPIREGNQYIAFGLGIGFLGALVALTLGATCPLCFIVAPGLVAVGLLKRRAARAGRRRETTREIRHGD